MSTASPAKVDLGALAHAVGELRVRVATKRKHVEAARVRCEDARRRSSRGRGEALRQTSKGPPPRAAAASLSSSSSSSSRPRLSLDEEEEEDSRRLLAAHVDALSRRKAELESRLERATDAAERADSAMAEVLAQLQCAAQRRSAALYGDDRIAGRTDQTPWAVAATRHRLARARLDYQTHDQTEASSRQSEDATSAALFNETCEAEDLEELKSRLVVVLDRVEVTKRRLDRAKRREAAWRTACLAHIRAAHEDTVRRQVDLLSAFIRRAGATSNAARHATDTDRDEIKLARFRRQVQEEEEADYARTVVGDPRPRQTATHSATSRTPTAA